MKNAGYIQLITGAIFFIMALNYSGLFGAILLLFAASMLLSGIGLLRANKEIKKLKKELNIE